MAVVSAGLRGAAVVIRQLARASAILAPLALSALASCTTRDVYLVAGSPHPLGSSGGSDGGHADASIDASEHDAACTVVTLHPLPSLGLYLMLDQSPGAQAQWGAVSSGLAAFIGDSSVAQWLDVGMQYFPLTYPFVFPAPTPNPACDATRYAIADVPIEPLSVPANTTALLASLANHGSAYGLQIGLEGLGADAPLDVALEGATSGARTWAVGGAANHGAIVLMTAGVPSNDSPTVCQTTLDGAVAAARVALSMGFSTYVIALGGPNGDMDAIAAAGGTGQSYPALSSSDVTVSLLQNRGYGLPLRRGRDLGRRHGAASNGSRRLPHDLPSGAQCLGLSATRRRARSRGSARRMVHRGSGCRCRRETLPEHLPAGSNGAARSHSRRRHELCDPGVSA